MPNLEKRTVRNNQGGYPCLLTGVQTYRLYQDCLLCHKSAKNDCSHQDTSPMVSHDNVDGCYSSLSELELELCQDMNRSSQPTRVAVMFIRNVIWATWRG